MDLHQFRERHLGKNGVVMPTPSTPCGDTPTHLEWRQEGKASNTGVHITLWLRCVGPSNATHKLELLSVTFCKETTSAEFTNLEALFNTKTGLGPWPWLPFFFTFCCLALPFYGVAMYNEAGKCPEELLLFVMGAGGPQNLGRPSSAKQCWHSWICRWQSILF